MKTRAITIALAAVALSGCLNRVAWMPDGRRLVYVQDSAVWLITLDGVRTKLADVAGFEEASVAAAPRGGLVAVVGKGPTGLSLDIRNEAGASVFKVGTKDVDPTLQPGCWSPDGTRLVVTTSARALVVEPAAQKYFWFEAGVLAPRFVSSGDLVGLVVSDRGAKLQRRDPSGATTAAAWKLPAGIEEPNPLILTGDASAAWWKGKRGDHEVTVLAGADGRILFSNTRTMIAAGSDDRSYVTAEDGYALIDARTGSVTNLNPVYNALLRMDLNWQLADPAAAAQRYDAEALLKNCLPAFSPDGTRAAILTPRMVCLITLKTAEVVAIAKW